MHRADIAVKRVCDNSFTYLGHRVEVDAVGRDSSKVSGRINGQLKTAEVPNKNLLWVGRHG